MAADPASELDRIDPVPQPLKLASGMVVEVMRLRTRQLFRLLKVLTHGAGPALLKQTLDFGADGEEFAGKLLALVVMSIPDAENEAIEFIQSMVQPHGIADRAAGKLTKADRERNEALWDELFREMHNPDPGDVLDIAELIVQNEAGELQALGKRLSQLLGLAAKTGQDSEAPSKAPSAKDLAETSQAGSRQRSTSSRTSTDGKTPTSSTSRSAGSARSPRRSAAGSSSSTQSG